MKGQWKRGFAGILAAVMMLGTSAAAAPGFEAYAEEITAQPEEQETEQTDGQPEEQTDGQIEEQPEEQAEDPEAQDSEDVALYVTLGNTEGKEIQIDFRQGGLELFESEGNYYYTHNGGAEESFNPETDIFVLTTDGQAVEADCSINISAFTSKTVLNIVLKDFQLRNDVSIYHSVWNHTAESVDVNLTLEGTNSIISGDGRAALRVPSGVTYYINGGEGSSLYLQGNTGIGENDAEGGSIVVTGNPKLTLKEGTIPTVEIDDQTTAGSWKQYVKNIDGVEPGDMYLMNRANARRVETVNRRSFQLNLNGGIQKNEKVRAIVKGDRENRNYIYGENNCLEKDNLPPTSQRCLVDFIRNYEATLVAPIWNEYRDFSGKEVTVRIRDGVSFIMRKNTSMTNLTSVVSDRGGTLVLEEGTTFSTGMLQDITVTILPEEDRAALYIMNSAKNVTITPGGTEPLKSGDKLVFLGTTDSEEETEEMRAVRKGIRINSQESLKPIHITIEKNGRYEHYLEAQILNTQVDEINFPDPVFRQYISENVDTNKDGQLNKQEIEAQDFFDIQGKDGAKIKSLEGVEIFEYLKWITFSDNEIEEADFSQNTRLIVMDGRNNHITNFTYTDETGAGVRMDGQTYDLACKGGIFDLSTLPGAFDPVRAGEWKLNGEEIGSHLNGTMLSGLKEGDKITYRYSWAKKAFARSTETFGVTLTVASDQKVNGWETEPGMQGWVYGQESGTPEGKPLYGTVSFTYSDAPDGTFTAQIPDKAGVWYMKASVPVTDAYTGLEKVVEFSVRKAPNEWKEKLSLKGWKEGEKANLPSAVSKYGIPVYSYSDRIDGVYSAAVPTAAGTWYVKASVEEGENYTALTSDPVSFVIASRENTEETQKPDSGSNSENNSGSSSGSNSGSGSSGGGNSPVRRAGSSAATGDKAMPGAWALLLLLSGAAVLLLEKKRRRQ